MKQIKTMALIILLGIVRITILILEIFSKIVSFAVAKVNMLCKHILQKI